MHIFCLLDALNLIVYVSDCIYDYMDIFMFEFYCSIYFSLLFLCVLAIVVLRNTDLSRESLLDILAADMAAAVILSANI